MNYACGRRVLEAWEAGRSARNAWLTIPDPYLAEIVAARGPVEAVTLDFSTGCSIAAQQWTRSAALPCTARRPWSGCPTVILH